MAGIEIKHVSQEFTSSNGSFTALSDIDLTFPAGSFTSIIGPSGCGKSTLLRIIADIQQPTTGTVMIDDASAREAREARKFGFVFQDPVLLPWRTSRNNVELPMQLVGMEKSSRADAADSLLRLVGLEGFEEAAPRTLSGGMARRVAIARALALKPEILLLDEPFAGLDEIRRQRMNLELQRIWVESETTAALVTHNVEEAVFMSDTVVVLGTKPGRVVETIDIPLSHPRDMELTLTHEFFELTKRLSGLLQTAYGDAE